MPFVDIQSTHKISRDCKKEILTEVCRVLGYVANKPKENIYTAFSQGEADLSQAFRVSISLAGKLTPQQRIQIKKDLSNFLSKYAKDCSKEGIDIYLSDFSLDSISRGGILFCDRTK